MENEPQIGELEDELRFLREQGEHLSAVIAQADIGIAVLQDGAFLLTNAKLSALTGYTQSALDTFTLDAFVHPEDRKRVLGQLERLRSEALPEVSLRFRLKHQSGKYRVMEATLSTLRWGGQPATLACVRDVTRRARHEEEGHRNRRLEAIGALAGGIAHDFNNILANITGYAELVRLSMPPESPQAADLKKVVTAARRAHALVERILTYSQRAETVLQPLSLDSLVRRADVLVRATMPANVDLHLDLANRDTCVLADATQIEQVLVNLTTNARHAMRETGGELRIAVKPVDVQASDRLAAELTPGEYVRLRVADTGLGMDEETLARIFEPFFTTKAQGRGTGIGLAMTLGIVEAHGGRILVSSTLGEGAVFDIYLPRVAQGSAVLETPVDMKIYPGTERILLVDDEPPLVELGEQLLGQFGYHVCGYTSPLQALAAFRENPQAYDLLVTDQNMPKLTGDQLATKLQELRPDLPMIMITGFSERCDRSRARELGFTGYLRKPVEISELTRAIRLSLGDDL